MSHGEITGTDKAHVPLEHIDKLGKLITAGFPEELADTRDPRIVFDLENRAAHFVEGLQVGLPFFSVRGHSPELAEPEPAFA